MGISEHSFESCKYKVISQASEGDADERHSMLILD